MYWIVGQGFGGMFYTPSATDPNSGPLLVLFALVLYTRTPVPARAPLGQLAPGVAGRWRRPSGRAGRSRVGPRPAMLFATVATAWVIAVAIAVLLDGPTKPPVQPAAPVTPFEGQVINPPALAPPIALSDDQGRPVSLSQYAQQGKAVLREHMVGRLQYLIGSAAQLRPVWSAWNLTDAEAGIAAIYGISAGGEAVTRYSSFFSPAELVHDVKRLEVL